MAIWKLRYVSIYNYSEELDTGGVTPLPNTAIHIWASYLDSYFNLTVKNELQGADAEFRISQMKPPRNHLLFSTN